MPTLSTPRACAYCIDRSVMIDYKEAKSIRKFLSPHGKILARGRSGLCAKHQRDVSLAIRRARIMALLPFVTR